MTDSLRAFLTNCLDYAGMFPPACLPLSEAFQNYKQYHKCPQAWMLARFICPATQLDELAHHHRLLDGAGPPVQLSVLTEKVHSGSNLIKSVESAAQSLMAFHNACGDRVQVTSVEVNIPPTELHSLSEDSVNQLLIKLHQLLTPAISVNGTIFIETKFNSEWSTTLPDLLTVISRLNRAESIMDRSRGHVDLGFKLRTGGLEKSSFPTSTQVTHVIAACQKAGVCWKATAGLHLPFPHIDHQTRAKAHGFINLIAASAIAHFRDIKEHEIKTILEDDNWKHFVFEQDQFHWRDYALSLEQIAKARNKGFTSFGSCSFEEPSQWLQKRDMLLQQGA